MTAVDCSSLDRLGHGRTAASRRLARRRHRSRPTCAFIAAWPTDLRTCVGVSRRAGLKRISGHKTGFWRTNNDETSGAHLTGAPRPAPRDFCSRRTPITLEKPTSPLANLSAWSFGTSSNHHRFPMRPLQRDCAIHPPSAGDVCVRVVIVVAVVVRRPFAGPSAGGI
jgi:hypothetical protein